jgi:O-antigen/teichoic acid export membrane protein
MNLSLNILTTVAARAVLVGLALVSSVLMARVLGPEGRGLFALVLLLPEWAKSLGLFGFEQANAVYAGLEPGRRRALVWQSGAIAGVVGAFFVTGGLVFLALGAPGLPALQSAPTSFVLLPILAIPGAIVINYWFGVLRGMNLILLLNAVDVGIKVVSVALVAVLLLWFRLDVAGAIWADFITTIGSVVVLMLLLRRAGVWGPPQLDRALLKRTSGFALPYYGGTAAAYVNYRVDELIVAVMLTPAELGFYVIAVGLAERLWLVTAAVGNALLPHLTNSPERDPALSAVVARHVMLWTGLACLAMFFVSDVLVEVLFSSSFLPAVPALCWLLPGIFTLSVGKILVAELLAREKPSHASWATAAAAVINLVGNLLLVPRLGITGAAIASSISYTLLSAVITWCYLRETGLTWSHLLPCRGDLAAYVGLWRRQTAPLTSK